MKHAEGMGRMMVDVWNATEYISNRTNDILNVIEHIGNVTKVTRDVTEEIAPGVCHGQLTELSLRWQ